jgi:prepilin signal peptidase PulO-like enzyme (type II secretory pathway)
VEIIFLILIFLIGISIGSFLNVVADRVPLKQSIVSPPSHCFNCGHVLVWKDMIPVISYIMLRGKCRYCGHSIGPRSMIVELVTGLLFILAGLCFSPGMKLLSIIIYSALFIVLGITEFEGQKVPSVFIYTGIALALVLAMVHPLTQTGPDITGAALGFILGAGLLAVVWIIFKLAKRDFIGIQNVWITGMIGASIGYPGIILAIIIAILIGIVILAMLWITGKNKQFRVPLVAILCCAALIVMYVGEGFTGKL